MSPADTAAVVAPAVRNKCGEIRIPIVCSVVWVMSVPTSPAFMGPPLLEEIHSASVGTFIALRSTGLASLR